MQIQVLGNVGAYDGDGREIPLGGPKQRTVFAMLCHAPGSTVSPDSLAHAVWGDTVPDRFARSLSTYVSNLRRELGAAIESRAGGYVLTIDPSHIDAVAAEAAVAEGRYADAVQLWRGEPYGDIDGHGALRGEIRRLNELHLTAQRGLVRSLVENGDNAEAVPLLGSLVEQHTLDEELVGLFMEALYRSGRHADALAVFTSYRTKLGEDLGLEPSPSLGELELKILQHDESLAPPPAASSGPARPTALPRRYSSFLGREKELSTIESAVTHGRLVNVVGPGGMGKSSVTIETARRLDTLPVAYLKLEPVRSTYVGHSLAEAIGLQPAGGTDPVSVVTSYLATYPHMLVLDGCEAHLTEVVRIVDQILSASESKVLATSRRPLALPGEHVIRLHELASVAAVALFFERARGLNPSEDNEEAVTRICDAVDRMPLAVELAAARAASIPLERIEARLEDQMRLLAQGSSDERRHASISSAIAWSYDLLEEPDRHAFTWVSLFAARFSIDDAIGLTGDEYIDDRIAELVRNSLLEPPNDQGRYRMLEPVRQFAHVRSDEEGEGSARRLRYVTWLAEESERRYADHRIEVDERAYFGWLKTTAGEITAATAWSREHGHPDLTLRLVAANGRFWTQVSDPALLSEHALATLDMEDVPHDSLYQRALAQTGWLCRMGDQEVATDLLERIDAEVDLAREAAGLQALLDASSGVRHQLQHIAMDEATALRLESDYARFLEVSEAFGEPLDREQYNQALFAEELGDFERARQLLDGAIESLGRLGTVCFAPHLNLKASLLGSEGRLEEAADLAGEAAHMAEAWGRPLHQTMCERHLAGIHLDLNQPDKAKAHLERHDQAMQIIGLPPAAVFNPDIVARLQAQTGEWHDFPVLVRRWLDTAPLRESPAWTAWIEGSRSDPDGVARMLHPTAAWLAAAGREDESRRILAAATMAFSQARSDLWEAIGEVARVEALRASLGSEPVDGVPQSLVEFHEYMMTLAADVH